MTIKVPDPPYIVAGAAGGPFVIYLVTPLRNSLTLGALDKSASAMSLYGQVFRNGLGDAFAGGVPMARAAVPGFLVLGPAFHMFKELVGGSSMAAVGLTAVSESLIFYGAESNNAQVAFNQKAVNNNTPQIAKLQNPLNPIGGGFGLHVTRNVLAMSGLRVFSAPCQSVITQLNSDMSPTTRVVLGDLVANVLVSAASAPLHQLYGWSVTTRAAETKHAQPFVQAATQFLKAQYLAPSGRLSSVAGRDMFLRVVYNATIFTLYGFIERTLVSTWPSSLQWGSS
uniref:Uncharacterized protein n=1 Tax=Amphora coffeiformis TaxID=265554 RepID=A0A7S3P7I8_9STRA|mmetsp:Transcript_23576/g.44858  ORF Transcript_23576/g.44858 Transcript_23576/m.44858 type:complete len:283 (-) Transcript_23576:101-949(-)|eukprot:scaffold38424_cov168-Amphora_coffeaeformis.AAC.9